MKAVYCFDKPPYTQYNKVFVGVEIDACSLFLNTGLP